MPVRLFCRLGGRYFKNDKLRLILLQQSNDRFNQIKQEYLNQIGNKIDGYTKLFIKGYGNDHKLISCFKELMFVSRELLDSLLVRINRLSKGDSITTSRSFLPFTKNLMSGKYDVLNLEIIKFLKANITYIFHIRKIRNEIKNNISNIEFRFVTDHFEALANIPIKDDEIELIQYLDIKNKDEALTNKRYNFTLILDLYFPEMIKFWETASLILNKSK